MPDELLRPIEVARELKISRALLFEWLASGYLPCVRLGTRVIRVRRSVLDEWLTTHAQGGPEAA
jgi:excisionase family DNA binding protein